MVQDHTLKKFDTDIEALRSVVTTMGGLVERQFIRSVDAIRLGDLGIVAQVLADENRVNQLHMESDLRCHQTIARQQPIAIDLREIIAIIHTNNDLERIGDEAKKIAMKTRDLQNAQAPIAMDRIERMATVVADMVRAAIDAFVRHDIRAAAALGERDVEVDGLRDTLTADLIAVMKERPATISSALALIFVVQSIERVGDHARNIAEYVVNVVEGVDLRHATPEEIARIAAGG
ncbi:phosphate signaling complex protein PhoU [Burkholderiaceae bacterium FT117]|uniref:phosphate signaling complex protein PhoU n=1 Tax=Zeimonas sediminis TaxID=2944268 RepID=UPI0023431B6A|nr:phosphate signaling complex protein PhoU [Zeimonas sediminis]MCM5570568.1 phosphate signaling complex protein PhoU [Zeimonas sediminis]